jgi:TonB family protein
MTKCRVVAAELLARLWKGRARYASGTAVVVLHVFLVWVLGTAILRPGENSDTAQILVSLIAPSSEAKASEQSPPEPQLLSIDPSADSIAEPQIEIQKSAPAVYGISSAYIVPPRPDPSAPNTNPRFPDGRPKGALAAQVILKLLVGADGRVEDARVARSSGQSELDALAVEFTKARWHFLPALQGGRMVEDWTTVLVHFAST